MLGWVEHTTLVTRRLAIAGDSGDHLPRAPPLSPPTPTLYTRRAEIELKQKQDKVAEIKRLQAQIADIKSELSKYEEQLEDCKTYQVRFGEGVHCLAGWLVGWSAGTQLDAITCCGCWCQWRRMSPS